MLEHVHRLVGVLPAHQEHLPEALEALMRENTSAKNKEYHIWGMVTNRKACAAEAPSPGPPGSTRRGWSTARKGAAPRVAGALPQVEEEHHPEGRRGLEPVRQRQPQGQKQPVDEPRSANSRLMSSTVPATGIT